MLKNRSRTLTNVQTFLPNFICIGAMKSGTRSLYNYLSLHPEIFMSEIKELDFFIESKNWKRGVEWYKSNFPESAKNIGECSPNYTKYPKFPGVPKKMYSLLPEAKLIYLVRDPIKRIISHYIHRVASGREKQKIEEVLTDSHKQAIYINCSKYYLQIEQYLEYYPASSILVIPTGDLASDRLNTLKKIFNFLNVDPNFFHEDFLQVAHQSKEKSQQTDLNLRISAIPGGKLIQSAMFRFLGHRVAKELLWLPIKPPALGSSTCQLLIELLQEDVQKLRSFTGYSFSDWSM